MNVHLFYLSLHLKIKYSSFKNRRMKLSDYGFIMIDPSYTKEQKTSLSSNAFKTTICCVQDIDMACASAQQLVADGVQLIELCGAFKGDMPEQVIKAIDGKVPVGHIAYSASEREKLMDFFKKTK